MKARSIIVATLLLCGAAIAQPYELANPGFEQGSIGKPPMGWLFGFGPMLAYTAFTVADSCAVQEHCGTIQSNDPVGPKGHAFLYQYANVKPYRGKKFRLRAAVRAKVSGLPNGAGLLARVHNTTGGTCFLDNMTDRRVTSGEWAYYEITGPVCGNADNIELGLQLWGSGVAWVDDVTLEFADSGSPFVQKTSTRQ